MEAEAVADIIKPNGMNQLGIKQGDDVTPRRIGARLAAHTALPSQLAHQMRRNQIANLLQYTQLALAWAAASLGFGFLFLHPSLWSLNDGGPSTFLSKNLHPYGMPVNLIVNS